MRGEKIHLKSHTGLRFLVLFARVCQTIKQQLLSFGRFGILNLTIWISK